MGSGQVPNMTKKDHKSIKQYALYKSSEVLVCVVPNYCMEKSSKDILHNN